MTDKELREIKQKVRDINKGPETEVERELRKIAKEIGAVEPEAHTWVEQLNRAIHAVLQTEMMSNACVSAKWSCIFAAIAAAVAFLSMLAAWATVLSK